MSHIPVLLQEVIKYLNPNKDGIYVDMTFGAGGYSHAILESGVKKVIAFDRDTNVLNIADEFKQKYKDKFEFFCASNDMIGDFLESYRGKIAGFVYDLGVSSMQIDHPDRGFSFQQDGPLDMRMNQEQILSAFEIINNYSEDEIANIIYEFGDERKSRLIAKQIVIHRKLNPIATTMQLAQIIHNVLGSQKNATNPATKTFQAIRIAVNDELSGLKKSLLQAKILLGIKGKIVVVSFHSGEDKIVKSVFNDWCGKKANFNRYLPQLNNDKVEAEFKLLLKGTIIATKDEVSKNVRARSAKLRVIEKQN